MSISSSIERLQLLSGVTSMNIVLKLLHDDVLITLCVLLCLYFIKKVLQTFFFFLL